MVNSSIPSAAQVGQILRDLLVEARSREEVADWAAKWVRADTPEVHDSATWEALRELSGADLKVSPTEYLHSEADFHRWLDDLENSSEMNQEGEP